MNARLALALLLTSIAACSRHTPEPPAPPPAASAGHVDEPEHEALPSRVKLPDDVAAAAKIETRRVERKALATTVSLPGEVAADPDRSGRVASPVAGVIQEVRFREGAKVKKGDVLAIVRVPELGKARAAAAATAAKAAAARANAKRLEALAEKRLAASQEVLSAQADADALEADARAATEQLAAMGTAGGTGATLSLRAPVSGVAIARDAVVGQPLTPEQTIASIADLSEVWFLARVFEKDLGRVRAQALAEIELNAFPKHRFQGTVDYVGRQIDPVARTLTARIRIINDEDRLRIGLFGTARVAVLEERPSEPVLVVPRTALTEIAGKQVVFVREPDGDYEMHEVLLGESGVAEVAVASGLREGEAVVVHGVFTLKSAVLKGTFGEEE